MFLLVFPSAAFCRVITADTTWSGEVLLEEDVLVPEGITLTISPGTKVRVASSESTKTDPEFMSSLTEITVRGTLIGDGNKGARVLFEPVEDKPSAWAGIIVDGGKAELRSCVIRHADTAIHVFRGSVSVTDADLVKNHYGMVLLGQEASARVEATTMKDNDYGIVLLNGARVDRKDTVIEGSRKKDLYSAAAKDYRPDVGEYTPRQKDTSRIYNDEALLGTTVWQKRVEVRGIVRVPENSRLIILPGTVVEFRRKDTNKDGIGENGLLVQGVVIAKGTKEDPIIFRSAEKQRRMGDWDAINIMNSDSSLNLIEYCQVEDAYRGLHFHFSHVAVTGSVLRNNYRGMQFQESEVEIRGNFFYGNKSGLQARDSDIVFTGNVIYNNYSGMNVLRNSIIISRNSIMNNYHEGLRVREGYSVVETNQIYGNRHGLMVTDSFYGKFSSNGISHNLESGLSIRGTEGIEVSGNVVQGNGINGMNIQESGGMIHGNLISDNGERGIGVLSFRGLITGNNMASNRLYNLGIDGESDVSAPGNWWGDGNIKDTIYDREKDPSKGRAGYLPVLEDPVAFSWPLPQVSGDAWWHGDIVITGTVSAAPGTNLKVSPKTRVFFAKGAGLIVKGRITAEGRQNGRISFISREQALPGTWEEILLDRAVGSVFSNCIFENATWALHSHFTDLRVEECLFSNNTGGLRFTGGPVLVERSFFGKNEVGIRAFRGTARINGNVITGNGVGVFVREKGGGLSLSGNNLYDNSEYNVRIGDFNNEDVVARNNWWGTLSPSDTLYDAAKEPGIGKVLYEPFAKEPFKLESPSLIPEGKKVKGGRENK